MSVVPRGTSCKSYKTGDTESLMSQDSERKDVLSTGPASESVEVNATDMRNRLGEMINRTIAGDRVVITRHGKTIAALIGARDLERLTAA
jgi:prevent-host-death family protein